MPVTISDEDRMIDANFVLQTGLFKSRSSLYKAEAAGEIPKSMKVGGARRWRLKTWLEHFTRIEAEAQRANSGDVLA